MVSWIGKKKVDLSVEAWCRTFNLPNVTEEEEEFIMNLPKEELFFRLTGERNLGISSFIKIKQLHQEPSVRLTAQVVMSVLIPKKGSKEQIKLEEGRLLYAMMYGKEINLAQMIVGRLRSVIGRKSSPICYGMHLMHMLEQAGINLKCADDVEDVIASVIDHHTLRRLGYKYEHGGWEFVGRGQVNVSFPAEGQGEHGAQDSPGHEEDHEDTTAPTQAESAAPSHPPSRPAPAHLQLASQISNLATKSEIAHLRQFLVEQLHLLQATVLSKLDSMDSRLKFCEETLHRHTSHTSPTPTTHDPKGKAPMTSPTASHHTSSHDSSSHHSHLPTPAATSPHHSPTHSHHSHSSPSPTATQYEFVARSTPKPTPTPQNTPSSDSEATHSDPSSHPHPSQDIPSQIPPAIPSIPIPSPPPTPSTLPSISQSPHPTPTTYQRRKVAVSKPKSPPA